MLLRPIACCLVTVLLVGLSGAPLVAAAPATDDGWMPLFNGKDFTGWYSYLEGEGRNNDPGHVFTVKDGVIHIYRDVADGKPAPFGYIATDKDYSSYRLRLEYKWGTKRFAPRATTVRDSGILYHVGRTDGPSPLWPRSVECQIQEQDVGDIFAVGTALTTTVDPKATGTDAHFLEAADGGVQKKIGDNRSVRRVVKSATYEVPGWNTVEVIVHGDRAAHVVNGKVNNRLHDICDFDPGAPKQPRKLAKGQILLQAEGAEIFYRNVAIKLLGDNDAD